MKDLEERGRIQCVSRGVVDDDVCASTCRGCRIDNISIISVFTVNSCPDNATLLVWSFSELFNDWVFCLRAKNQARPKFI